MSARFVFHTIYLVLASALTYFWTTHPDYSAYTLQLVAVLILLYFATHFFTKKKKGMARNVITLDLVILTMVLLLIVTQTGGLASPLIFTIYFLLFAVALLFEIEATLVLTGILIVFLTLLPSTNFSDIGHLTELVAIIMITPLAIFTSHEYERALKERELRQIRDAQIKHEETDTLLFISLNLKKTLTSALDKLSLVIPQTRGTNVRDNLTQLYQDLRELYRAADELQETVDQETDET